VNTQRQTYLEPGDFCFGAAPLQIKTLLGSCVTVTLWHPLRHIGGMCHIQMPGRSKGFGAHEFDGHYAEDAFALFDKALADSGSAAREYVAKLFGGGNMFPGSDTAAMDVGNRNLASVRQQFSVRNMEPTVEHVGGAGHRKLIFDLASGDVWLTFSNIESAKEAGCG
jgi:chemotaxis protein CheD